MALFDGDPAPVGPWGTLISIPLLALLSLEVIFLIREGWTLEVIRLSVETAVLIAFFSLVPPLVAIGWYFCLWHGLRHVLRLRRYHPPQSSTLSGNHSLALFLRRALPFTLLSLLFLWLGGLALPVAGDPTRWVALYLVLISALTFPHVIIVEWMDRKENAAAPTGLILQRH